MEDSQPDLSSELSAVGDFIPPSVDKTLLSSGVSYTHFSRVPSHLLPSSSDNTSDVVVPAKTAGPPCCLGVDEAGRGPVLGPMVYGLFYCAIPQQHPLLATKHHFDDSKVLTPAVRSDLMQKLCMSTTDLFDQCGWAVEVMSARDISANMLKPAAMYNLNAQAMDATIGLIRGIYDRGVNVREIYIDTIGNPATYQQKLERIFPTASITVAKKADSLYPCVSAASVCAKVTRDVALEQLYSTYTKGDGQTNRSNIDENSPQDTDPDGWGSGYPSDVRCTGWMKRHMDPVFGWGNECRFSWGTSKDLLDLKGEAALIDWPEEDDDENTQLTNYFGAEKESAPANRLATWFGTPVTETIF